MPKRSESNPSGGETAILGAILKILAEERRVPGTPDIVRVSGRGYQSTRAVLRRIGGWRKVPLVEGRDPEQPHLGVPRPEQWRTPKGVIPTTRGLELCIAMHRDGVLDCPLSRLRKVVDFLSENCGYDPRELLEGPESLAFLTLACVLPQ